MSRQRGSVDAPIFFESRAAFREWLTKNGATATEVWIGFYKKDSGKPGITYREAVDESLCFGWIDGRVRRIDETSHQQRYTPRRPGSIWSAINIRRAEELTALGLMTPAGRAAFERRTESRSRVYSFENQPKAFEPVREARFKTHPKAWAFFTSQPPGYQRTIRFWVESAKKEETREKRLDQLIESCARGVRIGLLSQKPPSDGDAAAATATKGTKAARRATPAETATAGTTTTTATPAKAAKSAKALKAGNVTKAAKATKRVNASNLVAKGRGR